MNLNFNPRAVATITSFPVKDVLLLVTMRCNGSLSRGHNSCIGGSFVWGIEGAIVGVGSRLSGLVSGLPDMLSGHLG